MGHSSPTVSIFVTCTTVRGRQFQQFVTNPFKSDAWHTWQPRAEHISCQTGWSRSFLAQAIRNYQLIHNLKCRAHVLDSLQFSRIFQFSLRSTTPSRTQNLTKCQIVQQLCRPLQQLHSPQIFTVRVNFLRPLWDCGCFLAGIRHSGIRVSVLQLAHLNSRSWCAMMRLSCVLVDYAHTISCYFYFFESFSEVI